MIALVLRRELPGPVPQLFAPRAELIGRGVADPADLERLAVLAEHAEPAEQCQLLRQEPVREHPHPQLVLEQRLAVERPPRLVRFVRSLRPVGDRVVHVELHVAVAGVALLEARDDEPLGVPPLPRRLRVVAGADVSELALRLRRSSGHWPA